MKQQISRQNSRVETADQQATRNSKPATRSYFSPTLRQIKRILLILLYSTVFAYMNWSFLDFYDPSTGLTPLSFS